MALWLRTYGSSMESSRLFQQQTQPIVYLFILTIILLWTSTTTPCLWLYRLCYWSKVIGWKEIIQVESTLPLWSISGIFTPLLIKNIGRILNLTTGFFSPQYHVVYDNQFTSVLNAVSDGLFANNPFSASRWEKLLSSELEHHINTDDFYPSDQHHGRCMTDMYVIWL